MFVPIIVATFFGVISAGQSSGRRIPMLMVGNFDQCEGKDVLNYTYIEQCTMDNLCTQNSNVDAGIQYLVGCQPNGQKIVNSLKVLAESELPAGAYYQSEFLFLIQSGNLEGKYAYIKQIGLTQAYLKKCSSALSYSYASTKSQILLIADKLDLNIFMNPSGAYEPFKRTATTICQGRSIVV